MSIFLIKIVAVFFMFVDHIKYAFPTCNNEFTLYFGRISFPLFAFGIVQGYNHTKNLKKYLERLFIAGLISQIPFHLFCSLPTLNVVALNINFTLTLGILAILAYDKIQNKIKGLIAVFFIAILASFIKVDYEMFGVFLIFSLYIFQDSKLKTFITSFFVISAKYLYRIIIANGEFSEYYIKNWIFTVLPLFIILFYNGKKGPSFKWFFYINQSFII